MVDNNQAQRLTADAIDELKEKHGSGKEIIRALVENSESFNQRTKFSQMKYLKKKQ